MSQNKLDEFWCGKTTLDSAAQTEGRVAAPLTDVFPLLEKFLDAIVVENCDVEKTIVDRLKLDQRNFFLNAARGMAVLAVRERRAVRLRYGLHSLLIEGARLDPRETISYLSLLSHSADKLDVDLALILNSLSSGVPQTARDIAERFLRKPVAQRGIEFFGFVEVSPDGEFDYRRTL